MLDQLLCITNAVTAMQQGGLLDELKRVLAERALNAETDHHRGREAGVGNLTDAYRVDVERLCEPSCTQLSGSGIGGLLPEADLVRLVALLERIKLREVASLRLLALQPGDIALLLTLVRE